MNLKKHHSLHILTALAVPALLAGTMSAAAQDNEYADALTEFANGTVTGFVGDPVVIAAIKEQNTMTAGYDAARIDELDQQWRAEVGAASTPLIDSVLTKPASTFLVGVQEDAAGLITEIFVTDAVGLNVAQSAVTSDYWQGDEDKWSMSYGAGAGAIHVGEVELDESTQTFQSQVSVTIVDPDSGDPIGAVTVGVDLSLL